jgi:hypothetical protein
VRAPLAPETPTLVPEGDGLRFVWPSREMGAYVERIRDERADTWAEVTFYALRAGAPEQHILGPARINLLSDSTASRIANNLARLASDASTLETWKADLHVMLNQVQALAIRHHRTPPTLINLAEVEVDDGPIAYLVAPFIPMRSPTLLVANGGGGKSLLALSVGFTVATGLALPGFQPAGGPRKVLYLDWETNEFEHARRLKQIARGFGQPVPPIAYFRIEQTIDQVSWLRAEIARQRPDLVIVDSVAYAVGGDLKEAGTATQLFRIVNSWETNVLVNHHENRDGGFYGTIFLRNSARSMWIMESSSTGHDLRLSLKHDKMNNGALVRDPVGLRLQFDEGQRLIRWHGLDVFATPELRVRQPVADQMRVALEGFGCAVEVESLAEDTGLSERQIKDTAREHPGEFHLWEGGGRGKKARIGLAAHEEVPF